MKHILLLLLLFTVTSFGQQKNGSIGFIENKGQIMDQNGKPNLAVQFLLNTNGLNVQIKKNGFSYDIYETKKRPIKHLITDKNYLLSKENDKKAPDYTLEYVFHRIDIDFVNANPNIQFISEEKLTDYDNYYNIPNKPEGVLMVHKFKQITYKNIYPNIDVVFSIPKDTLKAVEYNFVVHPNGKISDIQLKFTGAKTELIDNKIKMNVRFGEMEEILPASWTEDGMRKKSITVNYKKIKNNVYGFNTPNAVHGKTVIIDPVPVRLWGTFYGDEQNNGNITFGGITSDLLGNNYLTGFTMISNSSYATSGAHQTTIGNPTKMAYDGIIVKFSPSGNKLWSTYYGGEEYDKIYKIKTDYQNNVIIAGQTNSRTNISTVGSFNGYDDAFLVKFNALGVRIWGSYYGSSYYDAAYDIDIDKNNNIFMIGTFSINRSENIFDTPIGDGFIAKFSPNGNIIWNKLYGGKKTDEFRTIKVGENSIVVAGFSYSTDNISTIGVFQENLYPNTNLSPDGIIFKLNLNGDRLWSTYYGGETIDKINAIEIDDEENIYIGGETSSSMNIATPNSFDDANLYNETGFFAKLNQNGERLWGSYLGNKTKIYSLVFKNNSLYTGGNGGNDISITTLCAYKRNSFSSAYIGKFSKIGELIWGSYVGGADQYSETEITVKNNEIVVGGTSFTNEGIANSESYQPTILGPKNFYLMKFLEENDCNINANPSSNSPVCIGNKLMFNSDAGYNYSWTGPNNFTSDSQNPSIDNVSLINNGLYTLVVKDNCGCEKKYDFNVTIGDIQPPIPNLATLPTITGDCNTIINTTPTATDACAGAITATTVSPLSYNLPGTYTIVWSYNDGNGNTSTQNQTVTITNQPLPVANTLQTFCIQQNATLNNIAITGQNIKWYDAQTNGNLLPNTTALQNGITYYASQTINSCESERTPVLVTIQNTLLPTANTNQSFCTGTNPSIANIQVTGSQIKWYDAQNNGSLLSETTSLVDGKTYYTSQTVNSCESERLGIQVSIVNTPPAPTTNATASFCKNENAALEDIQILGQNIKWYDTNFSAASLPNTTLLEDNKTYYASQTIGCESNRTPVLIRVFNTPLPTANQNQQFCIDENAIISDVTITGSNIKWYDESSNGNQLSNTSLLLDGKTYYATQTLNNCESDKLAITVKIQDTQIPIANSPQTFCIQKNAKISDITISGQNIYWFESVSSSMPLAESTLLENGITYYASETINNCESNRIPVAIIIQEATSADCINFVNELPFPKFFTPNNDGYNDTWTIDFAYLKPNTGIQIFDRYGKLLKVLLPNSSWNGLFNNLELPATDYWFIVTRANGQEYKGHFSLKR